ncbi:MAG: hypothetical protein ABFD79_02585 [Phycisphaerales bacterium]
MKFIEVSRFNKIPKDIQDMLLASGVLPVTPVTMWTWDAINAKDENGNRKYKYIIGKGSSRSGKTFGYIDCLDRYCRENKGKRCTVWRDTKTDCVNTVLNDIKRHLGNTNRWKKKFAFNETRSVLKYEQNSTIEIQGTDQENTVMGLTSGVAWLNEPYKIPREIFNQIDQRTEDFMLLDLNPKMGHWSDDLAKDPRCIVIHSTFADNPLCPEESKAKILSYQPVSMCHLVESGLITKEQANEYDIEKNVSGFDVKYLKELARCRENEFKNSASAFNWSVYGLGLKAEKPNRIFSFTEIPDEEFHAVNAPIYTGVDWGAVDPWGIVDIKYYDGGLYLHERNYLSENLIRASLTTTERTQIDSADEGIVKWKFGKLGIPKNRVIVCDNNRTSKIIALRQAGWEYAVAAIKPKGSVLDGIDLVNNLRVYYTRSSENIRYEQENYSRKVDPHGVVLEDPEDKDNHIMDPTRYVAEFLAHPNQGIIKKA